MKGDVIAIDGPAGSGKSTVSRALAIELGWSFLDTGAMYRAVTWEALHQRISLDDTAAVGHLAQNVIVATLPRVTVNGRDIENDLRSEAVNAAVSVVAAQHLVRLAMVRRQREWVDLQSRGAVVEGRDIATVVFPQATLKVFLTATLLERTQRRGDESEESVLRRDEADTARSASPLRQATDAIVLDTTGRAIDEIVGEIIQCLMNRRLN